MYNNLQKGMKKGASLLLFNFQFFNFSILTSSFCLYFTSIFLPFTMFRPFAGVATCLPLRS